jgi:hypothetical protein
VQSLLPRLYAGFMGGSCHVGDIRRDEYAVQPPFTRQENPMIRTALKVVALTSAGALGAAGTAGAASAAPAYVGKWGSTKAQCRQAEGTPDAPMVIRAGGYDQYETHCTFSGISRSGTTWRMTASCAVDGDTAREPLRLTVTGRQLTYRWGTGAAQRLVRCP